MSKRMRFLLIVAGISALILAGILANARPDKEKYTQIEIAPYPYLRAVTAVPIAKTPEELLFSYSIKYDINYNLAWRIIQCESGWRQYAANNRSSADSYWQFLDGTWRSTMIRMDRDPFNDKFELPLNLEAGAWLLSEDGVRHWLESRNCWE